MRFISGLWQRFRAAVWELEQETLEFKAANGDKFDFKIAGVLVLACVCVSVLEYYGGSSDYRHWAPVLGLVAENPENVLRETFRRGEYAELFRLMYWAGSTFFWYLLIPALFVKLVLKGSLREHGLSFKGTLKHSWIYLILFLIVFPFVVAVAFTPEFQNTYPFYSKAGENWRGFLAWEMAYALQFLSLEFFYRGFLIHALRPRFGFYAVFVSVIPYCMIHFGKPFPETIGAIIAGLALGTLSVFTRNIWGGVLIHVAVAMSMDFLSLFLRGKFWFQL